MRLTPPSLILATLLACGSGCSRESAESIPVATSPVAADAAAKAMDEPAIRTAISAAIREQRLYSPTGNNAIEWYLQLRERRPDDHEVDTALIELEPYAVIAAEQSLSRGEFDEARRLIAVIERANRQASALQRLRDQLAQQMSVARLASEKSLAVHTLDPPVVETAPVIETTRMVAPAPVLAAPAPAPVALAPRQATAVEPANATTRPEVEPAIAAQVPAQASPASQTRVPLQLRSRAPRYPAKALLRKIEGSVELAFTIKADGSVADVRVLNATPRGIFEDAAIATAQLWQFEALGRDFPSRRSINFNLPKDAP